MYANGKGVQQNYAEAGKWWIKAAEGGDLAAARHAWNLYREVRAEQHHHSGQQQETKIQARHGQPEHGTSERRRPQGYD